MDKIGLIHSIADAAINIDFGRKGFATRVQGFPKDAFHIACISHKTRIQNILRTPGVDSIEKSLLKQRFANLPMAQISYIKKQKKALTG